MPRSLSWPLVFVLFAFSPSDPFAAALTLHGSALAALARRRRRPNLAASPTAAVHESAWPTALQESGGAPRLRLEVFYESLCPSCQQFIGTYLQDLWHDPELRALVDLHLYPSGHAVLTSSGMQCQHGASECLGNAIEACATRILKGPDEYVPLLGCMATATQLYSQCSVEDAMRACAAQLGVDTNPIVDCVISPTASGMMASIAAYTGGLLYTPWVLVDGQHYDAADQGGRLVDVLCAVASQRSAAAPLPAACGSIYAASAPALTALRQAASGHRDASAPLPVCMAPSPSSPTLASLPSSAPAVVQQAPAAGKASKALALLQVSDEE